MRRSFALAFLVVAACGDDASRTPDPRATSSGATAGAAPAIVDERPVPRTIELGDGLVVLVTENGQGEALGRGDEALVHYSISYVPVPAPLEAPKEDAKEVDAKKGSKSKDAKDEGAKSSTAGPESKSKAGSATSGDVDAAAAKTAETNGETESGGSKDETTPATAVSSDTEAPSEALAKDAPKPEDSKNAPASDATKGEVVADDAAKSVASGDAVATKAGDTTKPDAAAKQEATTADSATSAGETKDAPVGGASSKDAALATTPVDPSKPLEPVVVATTRDAFAPVALRLDETKAMKGLVRALVGLRVGTRAQVTVPAELAYGKDGLPSAGIPPGVTLSIDVDVRGVRH